MKRFFTSLSLVIFIAFIAKAQMWNGQDSLYGNEWIDLSADYYKFQVSEDGVYRIPQSALQTAGFPLASQPGASLRLYAYGEEVPIYITTNGPLGASDYIEFYGEKNRSQLDKHLFDNPESQQLNPEYSMFTDRAAYYLTWGASGIPARFEETANNLANPGNPIPYFIHESKVTYSNRPFTLADNNNVKYSNFDVGEGFGSIYSSNHEIALPAPALYANGPQSILDVRMVSDILEHELEIKFNGTTIVEQSFVGFDLRKYSEEIANGTVTDENALQILGNFGNKDKYGVSVVKLTYPRVFDFGALPVFAFDLITGSKSYLEITNFSNSGGAPVLYDLTNKMRIETAVDNDQVRVVLPQGQSNRKLVLSNNSDGVKNISSLSKINFPDLNSSNANYIIISHADLNNANSGTNPVAEYAGFRASPIGGNYDVQVINVKDIYECFGYGSPRHPISLRNFGNYIKKNWPNPEMIFIIGKGREYTFTRTDEDLNDPINDSYYIPTFGTPGADNLLFSSKNSSDIPIFPIGRLAATSPEDISVYLDKARSMAEVANLPQTIEDKGWTKKMLHLSGGDVSIQNTIANNLKTFENIIENNTFGADVSTFYKTSTDPIQISESEAIFDLINDGVSLITFFGHSGTGTFDFNIDNPDNFLNEGKLPLIISLGCYSGNIHSIGEGVSERFVFYKDKGAGAFLATTGPGYVYTLNLFGREFYQKLGEDNYGDPIGKVLLESLRPLNGATNLPIRSLVQQLTLNGDPAILMNPHPGPDYTISNTSVEFTPMVINAQLDSFEISFDVENLGRAVRDSFQVQIEQQTPTGERFNLSIQKIAAPFSKKRITVKVPNFGSSAAGLNRFYLKVDIENEIEELPSPSAEMNNSVRGADNMEGLAVFIFDNSLEPIFPENFGIVNGDNPINLISSTRDAMLPETNFIIELDTTEQFNSPLKIRQEFTQIGGVLSWQPPVSWENEMVYYWRTSPDSTSVEAPYIWKNRSFTYLTDSDPGWGQSHFYQYNKNEFDGMKVNQGEDFDYLTNGFFITIRNKVKAPNDPPAYIYDFGNAAESVRPWNIINSGIAFVVGDKITGGAWPNPAGGLHGSINPGFSRVFSFPTSTQAERQLVLEFIENVIPAEHYVWCFSVLRDQTSDFQPENWEEDEATFGKSIFSLLEDQGATQIRDLISGARPYTFIFQKDVKVFTEDLATNFDETIVSEVFIPILRTSGSVRSTKIGPAMDWKNLTWEIGTNDDAADSSYLQIIGIKDDFSLDTLESQIFDLSFDLSAIDASIYPRLQINLISEDNVLRTATDLINWRVTYAGFPDIAINPNGFLNVSKDSLNEGEKFVLETEIINTSNYPIAAVKVEATYSNNGNSEKQSKDIQNLAPGETTKVSFERSTFEDPGHNNFLIEANPQDQPKELYRFNNIATYNYFVNSDNSNPLLEVVFDGSPIMNGDIVSAKPHITISLKDENPYLSLSDTTLLKLILKDPNGETRGINFSDPAIVFYPANQDRNEVIVEWDPTFEIDGDYELIVQGEDVTGNQSGVLDYKILFRIINKKMISNVLNYPNPFSTATRFVYTLTGDETPSYFKIQIFSATGRIVKEITQDDLGPLKIGTHQTDYVWNGTDDFGDQLANGVYFYKVVTKNAMGESYESYINGNVDKFFEQGFGKLVIMR